MRCVVYGVSLCVALLIATTAAADQKTDAKDKLAKSGTLEGTLTQVEPTTKGFTVEVAVKTNKPNLAAQQNLINLQQQLVNARRVVNPVDRANQVANIQAEMAKNQRAAYEEQKYKFELEAADNAKVRRMQPPVALDDKGKPRKYTSKELAALKGQGPDRNLPGYTADFDGLKTGQKVKVTLSKPKDTKKTAAKDEDKDPAATKRLTATMIVIVAEEPKK